MSILQLPQEQKRWRGIFPGKYFGDLWQTLNIDLERVPGRLVLSNKFRRLAAGLGVVYKFLRTDATATDQWFAIVHNTDILRNGNTSIVGGTWITDNTTGTFNDPRDMELHEAANGEQRLVCTRATDIGILNVSGGANVWDDDWWTTTLAQTALTSSLFHPIARLQRLLAIGDIVTATTTKRAVIHTIDKDDTVSASRLIFPAGYTVRLAMASSDRFWFGLQGDAGQNAKIIEWDGFALTYNYEYELQGSFPLTSWLKNGIPFYITELGYIFKYTGGGFTKIQEFPMAEDRQVFATTFTAENIILPYGSWIDGGIVYINVGAPIRTGSSDLTGGSHRMRSGVWIFNTLNNNLYHHMGLGEHASAGTDVNFACSPVTTPGVVIRQIVSNQPRLVASASVPIGGAAWNSSSQTGIYQEIYNNDQVSNAGRNRGYFITPYLSSKEVMDMWEGLWVRLRRFVNSGNRIIVKSRVVEPLRDVDASDESPLQAQATWVSTTTFTCVVPTGVAVGDEVEVLTGDNGGCSFDISELSATPDGSASITVTISEAAPTSSTDTFIARFENWDSEIAISSTTVGNQWVPFTKSKHGEFIQLKVELRGFSVEIDDIIQLSKVNSKIQSR